MPISTGSITPELADLIVRCSAFDGVPPFSDGSLRALVARERELVWEFDDAGNRVAAALDSRSASEFVVDPDARGHGHGARMLDMLTHPSRGGGGPTKLFWAHGDHPGSRALAVHHKLETVRTLLHLRLEAVVAPESEPVETSTFTPADLPAVVALNARAFVGHPEQGAQTEADFEAAMAEPWFVADDLLLLRDAGELVGFCWLKVDGGPPEEARGEFYVVGVDPGHQGHGLGRNLMKAGLARLAERDIPSAHLYVEADNAPAVRLYRGLGFEQVGVDVQYHYIR